MTTVASTLVVVPLAPALASLSFMGIAPADQERIFEQFERTDGASQVPGLGLGLYIARQIAQAHQGRLEVRSSPGEGSEFILSLPLVPTPA